MSLFPEPFDLPARHLQRFWGVSIEKLSKKNLSKFNEFFFISLFIRTLSSTLKFLYYVTYLRSLGFWRFLAVTMG